MYMRIGAAYGAGYQPYIYNTNQLGSASLNRIKKVPDDALAGKTDFSSLVGDTENPLKVGETKNFADLLESQLAMGSRRAAMMNLIEE